MHYLNCPHAPPWGDIPPWWIITAAEDKYDAYELLAKRKEYRGMSNLRVALRGMQCYECDTKSFLPYQGDNFGILGRGPTWLAMFFGGPNHGDKQLMSRPERLMMFTQSKRPSPFVCDPLGDLNPSDLLNIIYHEYRAFTWNEKLKKIYYHYVRPRFPEYEAKDAREAIQNHDVPNTG